MSKPAMLSPAQRVRLLAFPKEERDLVRHYTLSDTDRAMLVSKRGEQNRLGFAVQLCCLRFPGQAFTANGGTAQIPRHGPCADRQHTSSYEKSRLVGR